MACRPSGESGCRRRPRPPRRRAGGVWSRQPVTRPGRCRGWWVPRSSQRGPIRCSRLRHPQSGVAAAFPGPLAEGCHLASHQARPCWTPLWRGASFPKCSHVVPCVGCGAGPPPSVDAVGASGRRSTGWWQRAAGPCVLIGLYDRRAGWQTALDACVTGLVESVRDRCRRLQRERAGRGDDVAGRIGCEEAPWPGLPGERMVGMQQKAPPSTEGVFTGPGQLPLATAPRRASSPRTPSAREAHPRAFGSSSCSSHPRAVLGTRRA